MDRELLKVWQLVHDLSEQLAHNQKITASLQNQAQSLQSQANQADGAVALRRFNTDISKEFFSSKLERDNAKVVIENQTLLHENKQLSSLLKEYETTMDGIMSKVRNHSLAAQQHELILTRHYEALLTARDNALPPHDLAGSPAAAVTLQRLAQHLRWHIELLAGRDPDSQSESTGIKESHQEPAEFQQPDPESEPKSEVAEEHKVEDPITYLLTIASELPDWSTAREEEILRLETENARLRELLNIDDPTMEKAGVSPAAVQQESIRHSGLFLNRPRSGSFSSASTPHQPNSPEMYPRQGTPGPPGSQPFLMGSDNLSMPHPPMAGAPLQRAMEMQPAQRTGAGRRTAMFGGRGGAPSLIRGGQPPPPPPPPPMWHPPQHQAMGGERPWLGTGPPAALDMGR